MLDRARDELPPRAECIDKAVEFEPCRITRVSAVLVDGAGRHFVRQHHFFVRHPEGMEKREMRRGREGKRHALL